MSEIESRDQGSEQESVLGSVEASRSEAVSSVVSGINLLLGGGALIGVALVGILGPVGGEVAFLGSLVAGTGLFKVGRAALHLFRFGRKLPAATLAAAAALGALVAAWPVLMVLQGLGVALWPSWFRQLFGGTVLTLCYATVILALTSILFRDRGDPVDVSPPRA